MGWVEIVRPDGSGFAMEGGEAVIYSSDLCDSCGERSLRKAGRGITIGELEVLWICDTCNTPRT